MSFKTVEVELDGGRVTPQGTETLPVKARALLTILQPTGEASGLPKAVSVGGLRHFLSLPDFALTPEQFRASMEVDFFEQ